MSRRIALALALSLGAAGPVAAQQVGAAPPRVRVTLTPVDSLALRPVSVLQPGSWLGVRTTSALVGARWEAATLRRIERARLRRARARILAALGIAPEAEPEAAEPPIVIPDPSELAEPEQPRTFEALARYADLGVELASHLEMKVDRLRNARCTAVDVSNPASGCQGGFPTPSFDQQFRLRAGGIVSQRLHVNVDFDSEREFSANNNINVWYQGLEDEILRRVEVGNVTFRAPASQFITAAIPANSFGVQADAQLGPVEISAIVAQQKGSALRTRTFLVGESTTQPLDAELRDLDFEQGRFFFVVDPEQLPGYPNVDVLGLDATGLPAQVQPTAVRVYRLRAQGGRVEVNPNLGGVDAVAIRPDSPQRVGPFPWELLVEGRDYYLDPSGAWFVMVRQLGSEDFLAVSYITALGDTIGTFPALNGTGDTLQLIHEPRRGPNVPTFRHEMRNAYRVGGGDVTRSSIGLTIVVNESEQPLNGQGTYLSRLGLAVPTDPSTIDQANRVFPRPRDPNGGEPIRDLFVIFPHLTPFADGTRLQPGERNDSLYRTPAYLLATEGPPPTFQLRLHYEATGAGDRSALSLGALQLREGSEKLFLGDQELRRGIDYQIDYQLGQVLFLNPDSLFFGPTEIRAQFEENQLFDLAPKNIFGLATTYRLGRESRINAIGLIQQDRTNFTRPQLGFEPQAGFIGGISTNLVLRPTVLTRALDALPLIETTVPSRLDISGEIALSKPNPNRAGVAYIEDFQQEAATRIRLIDRDFQRGSMPASGRGLPASHVSATGEFSPSDAVPLVWQNAVQTATGVLEFGPRDIDSTIVLSGSGFQIEPVLWLSLKPDTVGGAPNPRTGAPRWLRPHTPGPRWGSLTQSLGGGSGVGADLSRVEFIEFWVLEDAERSARQRNAILMLDFGTVLEDVVSAAPESLVVAGGDTAFSGLRFVGQGRLDTERDTLTNVYNAVVDDIGILGDQLDSIVDAGTGAVLRDFPVCDLEGLFGLPVFPRGDLAAICTRRNNRLDTEDLDGDNRLDVTVGATGEDAQRHVFPIGDDRYYVRDGVTTLDGRGRPLTWRLYRLPFRSDTVQVGRPNLRQVQAVRMTLVAPDEGPVEEEFWVVLARLRLVGAPWLKRAATPIAGLGGSRGEFHGEVRASVASTENRDLGYESPPGTFDLPDRKEAAFELGVTQVNEKSLRLLARDLRLGERAEAFVRFTDEADKNFLAYRNLRLWARGRGAGWLQGDLEFFVKVGRDENNFYLYRTPARTDTWEPEVVVDLERWLELRGQVEAAWLRGEPPSGAAACGGDSLAYVACDGPYLVQVRDPGLTPPNLARVSEVAVGMLRVGESVVIDEAELWVNDIRLGDVVDDMGVAVALDARLAAADVAQVNVAFTRRDGRFRQFDQSPSYVTDAATRVGSVVRLEKLLPDAWGLSVPFTVQHIRTSADPFYLSQTDIRGDVLPGLRRPRGSATTYDVGLRRARRGETWVERTLLDPVSLQVRGETSEQVASRSSATTRSRQVRAEYNSVAAPRTVRAAPDFLIRLVNALPRWIRESDFGKALRSARLRWNPYQIRFSSGLTNNVTERFAYRVPVELPSDTSLRPLPSVVHTWRSDAAIDLRPFGGLAVRVAYGSARDLRDYGDSTTVGRLIQRERRELFGTDVGFERQRTMTTALNVAPVISSWLRPRFIFSSSFRFDRDPNRRDAVRVDGDSSGAFRVPETLANSRRREIGAAIDLGRLGRAVAGDSGWAAELLGGILPADVSYILERRSSFDRAPFAADLRYHLALGGLGEFREQEGVLATSAGESVTFTASGGARLPLGTQVRVSYRNLRNTGWLRRLADESEIVQRNREWPSLNVSWVFSPGAGLRRLLSNVTAQVQYRETRSSSVQPQRLGPGAGVGEGAAGVTTENNSVQVAPSVTLVWGLGISTTAQYTNASSEAVTSGNTTRSDREIWGGAVNFAFRPPSSLVRLRNRIRTTVSLNASKLAVCLLRADADECRTVSDSRRQQIDVRMDTGFSETLRGGLTFSYVLTDQRHTSSKLSQIVFTIFADINLFAGQIR